MNRKAKHEQSAVVAAALQQHLSKKFMDESDSLNNLMKRMHPKPAKIQAKAVVDTGLKRTSTTSAPKPARREYVLDSRKPHQLSLAQKLGLVDSPQGPLSEDGWRGVKSKCVVRGDPGHPCPVCQEEFGQSPTVLLSCTHVFHRACLEAFESFSGKKTCPLCRREQYEKRIIYEGEKHFLSKCATIIQRNWRGYRVRKWYLNHRSSHPPSDPLLRHRWCEERVTRVTDQMLSAMRLDVDSFLNEISQDVAQSRQVMVSWDTRVLSSDQWFHILSQHRARQPAECPICLSDWRKDKARLLLSCSHVFHAVCLNTLESLSVDSAVRLCPVCRTGYSKLNITHDDCFDH